MLTINFLGLILKSENIINDSKINIIRLICNIYFFNDSLMLCIESEIWFKKDGYFRDFLNISQFSSILLGFIL